MQFLLANSPCVEIHKLSMHINYIQYLWLLPFHLSIPFLTAKSPVKYFHRKKWLKTPIIQGCPCRVGSNTIWILCITVQVLAHLICPGIGNCVQPHKHIIYVVSTIPLAHAQIPPWKEFPRFRSHCKHSTTFSLREKPRFNFVGLVTTNVGNDW